MDLSDETFYNNLIEKIKNDLKEKVNEKRYNHSLLVAKEAKKLALRYNEDERKAYVTGLAHDIAKDFSDEENKYFAEKYNLPKEIFNPKYHNILHSDIGAVACKEWYGFTDEMSDAIKYHTVANENMTTFEKIIFLADKIGRKNIPEDIANLPRLAYINLDEATLYFLKKQIVDLERRGLEISPITLKLIEHLEKECGKKA